VKREDAKREKEEQTMTTRSTPAGRRSRLRPRAARGFTLIELLLVLVILAVLAAVVVPKFTGRSEQARVAAAKADIASIELQLDAFEIDAGRYPTTEEGLSALVTPPQSVRAWNGPYLKKGMPIDPWNRPYVYRFPGQFAPGSPDVFSYGPDGNEGGGDDVVSAGTQAAQ
jgi:general secretion pathway protein G